MSLGRNVTLAVAAVATLVSVSCSSSADDVFTPEVLPLPADVNDYAPLAGFAEMDIPADNPLTAEKAALGRQLYFDHRISGDGSRSCYSCHVCEKGLTDGLPKAVGAFNKQLSRSSPSMWNLGFHSLWYWDGRATTLEGQVAAAWKGGNMGAGDTIDEKIAMLNATPGYSAQFQSVFGEAATVDNASAAIASYIRTIIGGNTPFDAWQAGDESAVSDAAKRGYEVFQQAGCNECHAAPLFTNMVFHNVGIGYDAATGEFDDVGRYKVSEADRDRGAFKTPTLRDIAQSAPSFHDGSVATLEEAVRLMAGGGIDNPHLDEKLEDRKLSDAQIGDLVAFLESLDEECSFPEPPLPPDAD